MRCSWAVENEVLRKYHDLEWGVPVHDDATHFQMITLEGAQAGLSWLTVLQKRENYRNLFKNFDPNEISRMSDKDLECCLLDAGIVRNRLKVYSVRKNASVFLEMQKEFGTFNAYIWSFTNGKQLLVKHEDKSAGKEIYEPVSKELKQRGMSFVGPTIIQSYLLAIGVLNGHEKGCYRRGECRK